MGLNMNSTNLLNKLIASIKKREEIKEEIHTKSERVILELINKIKEVYKDYLDIISSGMLPLRYLNFKTDDEDIGFCGTLELNINMKKLVVDRIGFLPQHTISFCKDGAFLDGYCYFGKKVSVKIDSFSAKEITQIIKTLNYMLENKQMIFEGLEECISKELNYKITVCSEETDILENNLNFIKSINL
jgi:hypothetical protein